MSALRLVQTRFVTRFLSTGRDQLPVLTLFTKTSGCSLCDKAKEILDKYRHRFAYEEVYIDLPEHSSWHKQYCYDIPVIHLNGNYLMKHRINEQQLIKALHNHHGSNNK